MYQPSRGPLPRAESVDMANFDKIDGSRTIPGAGETIQPRGSS
jgi:hypothetical protein